MFLLKGEPNDSLKAPFLFPWGDKWTVSCAVINPMIRGPKRGQLRLMHTPLPHVTHRSSGMTHETVARGPACPAVTPPPAKTAVHRHCWLTASVFYASSRSPSRIWCAIRFLGCNLWECLFIYFHCVYFLPELLVCSVKENCIEMTLLFLQRARPRTEGSPGRLLCDFTWGGGRSCSSPNRKKETQVVTQKIADVTLTSILFIFV